MSTNVTPEVNGAVDALFAANGLQDAQGNRNLAALAETLYGVIAPAVVGGLDERGKAVRLWPALVDAAFPGMSGEDPDLTPDPETTRAIHREAARLVWERCKPAPNGAVQQLVALRNPGLVLVRTKANPERADAVYLTADRACLWTDYLEGARKRVRRADANLGAHAALVAARIPTLARDAERDYRRTTRDAIAAGLAPIRAALPESTDNGED